MDMSSANVSSFSSSKSAPSYPVLSQAIVSVEHPFIIKDLSKAMEKLGQPQELADLVDPLQVDSQACLYLRPEDRMSRPIWSGNVKTGNVVVRVTLPKRTGRRRERGSSHEFQLPLEHRNEAEDPMASIVSRNTGQFLQGLSDNVGKYTISPVGLVRQTHRFRSLPDFVWSTAESPFAKKVREQLLPSTLEGIKSFKFDMSKGPKINEDLLPPPSLSRMTVPFNYSYRQNPATKLTRDAQGQLDTINTQAPPRLQTIIISYDIEKVPEEPLAGMTPYERLDDKLRGLVDVVRALFDERPIWTRRALKNRIHQEHFVLIGKYTYQYVGYMFSSGPWRDSVVKYGIDPRTDPKYRVYQTLVLKMKAPNVLSKKAQRTGSHAYNSKARGGARSAINVPEGMSHIFDGKTVSSEGRTWQVCDVVDPPLKKVLATKNFRSHCDIYGDGWYHNGTWALVRAVMRVKIDHIIDGKGVLPESEYAPIMAMPEIIDSSNKHLTVLQFPRKASGTDRFQMELLALFRTILNVPESEPQSNGQLTEGAEDGGAEELEEEDKDEDELVDPRLREMRNELDMREKNGEMPGSMATEAEVGQDEDDNEDDLEGLLNEGNNRSGEDSGSGSTELDEDDDGGSTEDEVYDGNADDDWENVDEDEVMVDAVNIDEGDTSGEEAGNFVA